MVCLCILYEATKYESVEQAEIEIGIEEKEAEVEIGRASVAGLSHQTKETAKGELLIFINALSLVNCCSRCL